MSCSTAANAYNKAQVIRSCDRTLDFIQKAREEYKNELFSGRRKYWVGRPLSVEEAWARGSHYERRLVIFLYGSQEDTVKLIKSSALLCDEDSVYLTNEQLSSILSFWDVV